MAIEVGSEVGDFRIEGVLGRGGMGVVYEARQLALDRVVALKVLSPELSLDESFRERFRREGLIQAQIDHPHIVPVYGAGEHEGALYLAMRLVRGPTLKELVAARELEAARTLRILTPVADALDAANEVGLIHRDVKPQNILVGARDHAFLADFGLTKGPTEQRSLTRTGQFVGTLDYISPEQIRGEAATASSDVYALGAVLYECLTGVVPFPKQSDAAVLYAHMSEDAPLVTEQRPDLPQALDEVILRAMAKNPSDRHDTATLLLHEAERAFGRRIRAAITPPVPIEIPEEAGIRRREEDVTTLETRVRNVVELSPESAPAAAPEARETAHPPGREPSAPAAPPPETRQSPERPDAAPDSGSSPPPGPAAPTRASPEPDESGGHAATPERERSRADLPAAATIAPFVAPAPPPESEDDAPSASDAGASDPNEPDRLSASGAAVAAPELDVPSPAGDDVAANDAGTRGAAPHDRQRDAATEVPDAVPGPRPEPDRPPRTDDAVTQAPDQPFPPATPVERRRTRPADPAVAALRGERTRPPTPVPQRPPAAAAPAARRRPNAAAFAGLAALVAVAAIVAGYLTGRSGAPAKPGPTSLASNGDLQLRYPAPWAAAHDAVHIPGLAFSRRVDLDATKGAGLAVGRVAGEGPTLLPADFLRRLPRAPARDDRVRLGQVRAYRYAGLRPKGFGRPLTLYVAPTSAGVTAIACYGARGATAVAPSCEQVAASLRLTRGKARALGPDPVYAKRLDAVVGRLNSGRVSGTRRLRAARTRLSQASAASALARVYGGAAARVRRLSPGPDARPPHRALERALGAGRTAFTDLARAAARGRKSRFSAARTAAARADRAIRGALNDLRASGYAVR